SSTASELLVLLLPGVKVRARGRQRSPHGHTYLSCPPLLSAFPGAVEDDTK
ncbi:origin recognition complex subunit 4 isoform X1, partial [Sigmodon hispidus]